MKPNNTNYLPGLNGIRAIALLVVLYCHICLFIEGFGFQRNVLPTSMKGSLAVTLFFVLSGFLITHLILKEKDKNGTVDIKSFYFRRALRIWPIYFIVLFLSLMLHYDTIIHSQNVPLKLLLYSFFATNVAFVTNLSIVGLTHLWSVGVEEQFYLFWPWIIKKVKKPLPVLVALFVVLQIILVLLRFFEFGVFFDFFFQSRFDSMIMGAGVAYLAYTNHPILSFFKLKATQVICWIMFVVPFFVTSKWIPDIIENQFFSFFYAIIIYNVSFNANTILRLENAIFNWIGKISYGAYVYHMLVLNSVGILVKGKLTNPWLLIPLTILPTLVVAHFSYIYIEKPFLKYKERYNRLAK